MFEVELKFPVESLTKVREEFFEIGAVSQSTTVQSDEYLNDPIRDFAKLDMALRIRCDGDRYCVTFKGPNLDATAKIRKEVEMPLADEHAAAQMKEIYEGIGFVSVAKVVKRREELLVNWRGTKVHVCLDEVDEVGGFVELELVVKDQGSVAEAKTSLVGLAEHVGLSGVTRTSYLEMLLKNRGML